jgi:hypothetical protein
MMEKRAGAAWLLRALCTRAFRACWPALVAAVEAEEARARSLPSLAATAAAAMREEQAMCDAVAASGLLGGRYDSGGEADEPYVSYTPPLAQSPSHSCVPATPTTVRIAKHGGKVGNRQRQWHSLPHATGLPQVQGKRE